MKIDSYNAHLTYCLNVHPGETWDENFASIRTHAIQVRDIVSVGRQFGLGLRLSCRAALELSAEDKIKEFKEFLDQNNMYVFTINGFPFGEFHAVPVKQNVYMPDWRSGERQEYTLILIDILSQLLPEGMTGSISTVPFAYKGWIKEEGEWVEALKSLTACAARCARVLEKTGREIHIGLEMEPDCMLETTGEAIECMQERVLGVGSEIMSKATGWSLAQSDEVLQRHIGVCLDTCHIAVQFERIEESVRKFSDAGVRISKVQISSALKADVTAEALARLAGYNDPVYLHQVKARTEEGKIMSWPDLPEFLSDAKPDSSWEARVHFHVPVYFQGDGVVGSTSRMLNNALFQKMVRCGVEHFEIETYTFNVLPDDLRGRGVVSSVADEYKLVMERMGQ